MNHLQFIRYMTLSLLAVMALPGVAEEGMFPMSELKSLDLQSEGLLIGTDAIYNPDGVALVDGICKLGGCTGSFVSDQGLILTNHHCAFRAISAASTGAADYLAEGFTALTMADEVPAMGYTVRITQSFEDVSRQVLAVVTPDMDPLERTQAIEKVTKQISLEYEAEHPGLRAEVAEMFQGKTYVCFHYIYLKDVRLVYAPPAAVGNFGGEFDNWMWPRHTGDFSFMRAYVGPDGQPADHAPDNIPYRPRKVLAISPEGVDENDFVFLFGYPGRTYRNSSSHFLAFQTDCRMPLVVDWYTWQIKTLEALGQDDRDVQLRLARRIKSLHNTGKNYRGKLQGIARLDLIAQRQQAEHELQAYIEADRQRQERYGDLLSRLAAFYTDRQEVEPYELWLHFLTTSPQVMSVAMTLWENAREQTKPETERQKSYMARNLDQTLDRLVIKADGFVPEADGLILLEMLRRAESIPDAAAVSPLAGMIGAAGVAEATAFVGDALARTKVMDTVFLRAAFEMSADELADQRDPFLDLAAALYPLRVAARERSEQRRGELDPLQADWLDVKRDFETTSFIPDANGTLRFTYGRVEGYSPRDAVRYTPLTSTRGLLQKETGWKPFLLPEALKDLVDAGEFGSFAGAETDGVPVNVLYSTDTTGGNSGSPVFNAQGQIVGLNFDRAWEATINDYAWHQSYSRSIGVDIRYVLWVAWKFGGTDRLLREMNIDPE